MGVFKYVGAERSDEAIVYVHPDHGGESRHVFEPGEVVEAAHNPDEALFEAVDDAPKFVESKPVWEPAQVTHVEVEDD